MVENLVKKLLWYSGDDSEKEQHVFRVCLWSTELLDYRETPDEVNLPVGCIGIIRERKKKIRWSFW